MSSTASHQHRVSIIAAQVLRFFELRQPFRIYHGSTNSTRPTHFDQDKMIDTSGLSNVLKIDDEHKIAVVEPNVSMDCLAKRALKCGLIPKVVMEFPKITVGGGFSGTSGESSSFRHGLFESTVSRIEIVLGSGEVVTASPNEHPDLFFGSASSFGTLGVTTLLEVQLMDAKPFVELCFYSVSNAADAILQLQEATKDSTVDYVDGILFDYYRGVVCIGRLADRPSSNQPITRFSRATDEWFYIHAEQLITKTGGPVVETVPIEDYLFRYDRGGFWVGSFAFKYFHTPFTRFTRWLLDDFLYTEFMYRALHTGGLSDRYVIQDVGIPFHNAEEFLVHLDSQYKFYPLWLCPLGQTSNPLQSTFSSFAPKQSAHGLEMILNIGVWGIGPKVVSKFRDVNRAFEKTVFEMEGKKWLYGHTYYTDEEFWRIYDRQGYEALREKYHGAYLPNIFDKVRQKDVINKGPMTMGGKVKDWFWNVWPLRGVYGLFQGALGTDYLLTRQWHIVRFGRWLSSRKLISLFFADASK